MVPRPLHGHARARWRSTAWHRRHRAAAGRAHPRRGTRGAAASASWAFAVKESPWPTRRPRRLPRLPAAARRIWRHALTPAERAALGKAARAQHPATASGMFDPPAGPARPRWPAGAAGRIARARTGAGPVWADAGVSLHLLPRRRPGHGARPGRDAHDRPDRPGLRRRAPVQLRRLSPRQSGAWSSTSTTSTKRCPGRGSGMSSAWPPAWRWPAGTTPTPARTAARS